MTRLTKLLEFSGVDTLRYLIGIRAISDQTSAPDFKTIKLKIDTITGTEKLDFASSYCEAWLKRLDDQYDTVQSKAFTLMSAAGVSASFIIGFSGLLLDSAKSSQISVPGVPSLLFVLTVVSFLLTVVFAIRTVSVATYAYPDLDDIYKLSEVDIDGIKLEYIASLIQSISENEIVINEKVTYLSSAQIWFKNSLFFLLLIAILIALAPL